MYVENMKEKNKDSEYLLLLKNNVQTNLVWEEQVQV